MVPSRIHTQFATPWRSPTTTRFARSRTKTRLTFALEKMPNEILLNHLPAVPGEHRVHTPLILAKDLRAKSH